MRAVDVIFEAGVIANRINEVSPTNGFMNRERTECPRCKNKTKLVEKPLNALSRRDNKTFICPHCGVEEAMFDFLLFQSELPSEEKEEAREIESVWLTKKRGEDEDTGGAKS
jgi:hypothetical protein